MHWEGFTSRVTLFFIFRVACVEVPFCITPKLQLPPPCGRAPGDSHRGALQANRPAAKLRANPPFPPLSGEAIVFPTLFIHTIASGTLRKYAVLFFFHFFPFLNLHKFHIHFNVMSMHPNMRHKGSCAPPGLWGGSSRQLPLYIERKLEFHMLLT